MFEKVNVRIDPLATDNNCYNNCLAKMERNGGDVVVGWRRTPATTPTRQGVLLASLDHHAVWRSPTGELIDISPRVALKGDQLLTGIVDSEIDFEPEPEATFDAEGRALPSRYVPLACDTFGLLQQACNWANRAAGHESARRADKAAYANRKVKQLLEQHVNRSNS